MLFYEPLFLFLFFPIVFTAFLAVRHRAGSSGRRAAGGEPVFLSVERAAFRPGRVADLCRRLRAGAAGSATAAFPQLALHCSLGVSLKEQHAYSHGAACCVGVMNGCGLLDPGG